MFGQRGNKFYAVSGMFGQRGNKFYAVSGMFGQPGFPATTPLHPPGSPATLRKSNPSPQESNHVRQEPSQKEENAHEREEAEVTRAELRQRLVMHRQGLLLADRCDVQSDDEETVPCVVLSEASATELVNALSWALDHLSDGYSDAQPDFIPNAVRH